MTSGERSLSISAARLKPLFAGARDAGVDSRELLKSLALPAALLKNADAAVSLADYYRIQNRLMLLTGDETLHMSSRQLLPGSTDFVLRNVGECANLVEVMQVIASTYNLLHGGNYNSVVRRRGGVDYLIDDRDFPYAAGQSEETIQFSIECILIFLHCMLMTVSNRADNAVRSVSIRRLSPGGDCGHLGYWDAPMKFGAPSYVVTFARADAEAPISVPPPSALSSNTVYQKIAEAVAGRHERQQPVAARVNALIARGVVEQPAVAAELGVSVPTLRRRLSDEGVSFRDLRRETLNAAAKKLLSEKRQVADVAEALGFSEFRAFNRAFKDWNGVTPKAFLRDLPRRT